MTGWSVNSGLEGMWKEVVVAWFDILFLILLWRTEERHEIPQSQQTVAGHNFESVAFRIWFKSDDCSTDAFSQECRIVQGYCQFMTRKSVRLHTGADDNCSRLEYDAMQIGNSCIINWVPWRWMERAPWECWDLYTNIHDVIFQKNMIHNKRFTGIVITEFKDAKVARVLF